MIAWKTPNQADQMADFVCRLTQISVEIALASPGGNGDHASSPRPIQVLVDIKRNVAMTRMERSKLSAGRLVTGMSTDHSHWDGRSEDDRFGDLPDKRPFLLVAPVHADNDVVDRPIPGELGY